MPEVTTTGNRVPSRGGRVSPGDMTGRQKAADAKSQHDEQMRDSAENQVQSWDDNFEQANSVFDAQTNERLDDEHTLIFDGPVDAPLDASPPPVFGRFEDDEPVLTGRETEADMAPLLVRPEKAVRRPAVMRSALSTVRVNSDIEQMTYGMRNGEPNNFNFRENFKYRLPTEVAEHLEHLGYVAQWY
jgi:hypothetical protein